MQGCREKDVIDAVPERAKNLSHHTKDDEEAVELAKRVGRDPKIPDPGFANVTKVGR